MTHPVVLSLSSAVETSTTNLAVLRGETLFVGGSGFSTATDVTINGASVPYTVVSDFEVTLTVPSTATTGPVVVENPDGFSGSSRGVVICRAGPWLTLADLYWIRDVSTAGGELILLNKAASGSTEVPFDADFTTRYDALRSVYDTAWAGPGAVDDLGPPEVGVVPSSGSSLSIIPGVGTGPDLPWEVGAAAAEMFARIDYSSIIAAAFLTESDLGGLPTGAASVRYENTTGQLSLVSGGGQRVVWTASVNKAANVWTIARQGTFDIGDPTDQADAWVTPFVGGGVASVTATSAMASGVVEVTVTDSGALDGDDRVNYVAFPAVDQFDLDVDATSVAAGVIEADQNDMALTPARAGPKMHPPRYRWLYPITSFVQPPLRQFPRDDALGGAPRQGHQSQSIQASARQGWLGSYR